MVQGRPRSVRLNLDGYIDVWRARKIPDHWRADQAAHGHERPDAHRIRLSCASIHSPPASLWNSARSRPRGAR